MKLHVKLSTILSISIILIVSISYIFNYATIYNREYHSRDIVIMVAISVISILAIIITNTLIIKELTSRITTLLEQVHWISKGNFGSTIHIEKTDEISKLGRSINQLSLFLLQLKISHVEKENKLHYQSSHDHLTGLANRTYLYHHLMEIKEAGQQATIIIYDIDGFKGLNDLLGEKAGDSLLSAVGKKIQKIAASHFVARISGDEFAVVVKDLIANENINQLVEEIKWHTQKPITLEGEEIRVSLSGGISKYDAIEQDIESCLTHAALALMEAKRKGRGEVVNYDRSMSLLSSEQIEIENRLYQAVKNKEIYLEYQPKVSVNSGEIVGVEALARWKDAKLGIIPPNRFIPIAEEKGLNLEITKQILFEACKQAKIWNTQELFIPVSVKALTFLLNNNRSLRMLY
ncbi:diguanylate cyclase domain-containing protein [Sutcliffiella sp. NPDC057660]|uniref:diguanylate cyclase domain-containing protein n=1 Tax=Sutcliffiella sp. NPDC057660 TaxID=3346199 RepID=UPI00367EDC72